MYNKAIINIQPLGFMWNTTDPFLFCVHHLDHFPPGTASLGPDPALLRNRNIGQDFTLRDGWRMYHGETIPGFPAHPHRGFETVTIVLNGLVDHSDSHGAAGRYGNGDVQWMTAGAGLQHAEMFPLLNRNKDNPLELFQVWLNLPANRKFAAPHYAMLWSEDIPTYKTLDKNGKLVEVRIIAGSINNIVAPPPAPDSWAAEPQNEVAIWLIKMQGGAHWDLPPASPEVRRTLYFYKGAELRIAGVEIEPYHSVQVHADQEISLTSVEEDCYLLMLQGLPINEPVAQYGPFVMNTHQEIQEAISDFRRTQFGGWPWPEADHVHSPAKGRFAKYADGTEEIR